MKKYAVLAASIVLLTIMGGMYAWSAFVPFLTAHYGLSRGESGLIFGLMVATFTVTTIPAGRWLERTGARRVAMTGAVLFACGYLLSSASGGRLAWILLGTGVIAGAGIGFSYVSALTVGMAWFPLHKGLVTGMTVAGFGGGAILLNILAGHLLYIWRWDMLEVFRFVGAIFGGVAIASAAFITGPTRAVAQGAPQPVLPFGTCLRQPLFWWLCVGMFAGTFAGLLTIGNLKPIALGLGLTAQHAAWSISIFSAGNVAGRVIWGQVHDRLPMETTILLSLGLLGAALALLLVPLPAAAVLVVTFLCGSGFGACFVVYASSFVKCYGVALFPRLYPLCFLGYGLAGITGPAIGGWIKDATDSYTGAVVLGVGVVAAALAAVGTGLTRMAKNRISAPAPN